MTKQEQVQLVNQIIGVLGSMYLQGTESGKHFSAVEGLKQLFQVLNAELEAESKKEDAS